uniref:Uncharacterized protein n=1 Tax=Lepeophtheirus salmonis TaxID=72036 RepID=A0A0K2V403_LEPSM
MKLRMRMIKMRVPIFRIRNERKGKHLCFPTLRLFIQIFFISPKMGQGWGRRRRGGGMGSKILIEFGEEFSRRGCFLFVK